MNRINKIWHWEFLVVLAALALAAVGSARGASASDFLVFGNKTISFRPQLEMTEQWNDNIFYTTTNTISDLITIISPGFRVIAGEDLPDENHFTLGYNYDQLFYLDRSDQNAAQHRFFTSSRYAWNRLEIEGSDRVQFLSSVLGAGFSVSTNGVAVTGIKVDRIVFADNYRADYRIGERTAIYLEGQHSAADYERGISLYDTRSIRGTSGFEWRYSRKTRFFGEFYYGMTDLERNATNIVVAPGTTFFGGFLGARGDFTEKLRGKIKVGYEMSSFREKSGVVATNLEAGSSPVVEAALSYAFSERIAGTFSYSRRQQVSVQFDRSSYVMDAVNLGFTQIIGSTGRLRASLGGTYEMYTYDQARAYTSRNDSMWRAEAGLAYYFQTWLSTRLQVAHESFKSDYAPAVDYDANRVTLSLAIGY